MHSYRFKEGVSVERTEWSGGRILFSELPKEARIATNLKYKLGAKSS